MIEGFEKRLTGNYRDGKTGQCGKWWRLKRHEVEEALLNYIEKKYKAKLIPKKDREVRLTLGEDCLEAEIAVIEKEK